MFWKISKHRNHDCVHIVYKRGDTHLLEAPNLSLGLLNLLKRSRCYYLTHAITRTMTGQSLPFSLAPKDAPRTYARMKKAAKAKERSVNARRWAMSRQVKPQGPKSPFGGKIACDHAGLVINTFTSLFPVIRSNQIFGCM